MAAAESTTAWKMVSPGEFTTLRMPLHELAMPREAEVHLWYLDLGRLSLALRGALGGLREEASVNPPSTGQLRFIRRFYLRILLGAYLGIPGKEIVINRSQRGKPVLDESAHETALHFSMAKSKDRLLIGISASGHVGVDLEPADRQAHDPLGVAQRYFSVAEAQALEALDHSRLNEAFLRAWACKEAVVKASGRGIANQLCRFTVETHPDRRPAVLDFTDDDHSGWTLELVSPDDGFVGAVAAGHSDMVIKPFRLASA